MFNSKPTRHQWLEYLADKTQAVLAAHRAPGRVTGGTVGPRVIRFILEPAPHIRFAAIKRLQDDLALTLQVDTLSIERSAEGIVLAFPNPEPRPVTLEGLLSEAAPLPVCTALLGLCIDGAPLLARLPSPDVAHILIAGTTGSGKSVLLRTLTASLILSNSATVLGIVALDPKGRTFPPDLACPHLLRPVITAPAEATEALSSIVHLMELRDQQGIHFPRLVVIIDELADLVMGADGLEQQLMRLAQRGREAGIHLVVATQRPSAAILSGLTRANFPLRLVGRVVSPDDARVAAGRGGTQAHLLTGRGDFIAVTNGGANIHFQAAIITPAELQARAGALPPARNALQPPAPLPASSAALQPDDLVALTARLRPWWEKNGGRWGSKTKALHFLFGDQAPAAGFHWEMTQAAIDRVEISTST